MSRGKVEMLLKVFGHLMRGIMIKGDVSPDAFQRPGAMALDMLKWNIRIKGKRGT